MARSYAKIHVGIWNDPDFLELDRDSMLTYQFLLEQPKMRTCGVIDMQVRRWAPKLHMTAGELRTVLDRLAGRMFIAIDDDTEELAVRTFVKHDAGDTKNWKVWIGVWSSLDAVESGYLRSFVAYYMPDGAYEPKAKPTVIRPPSIPSRSSPDSQSDHRSIEEKGGVVDYQSDTQSIASGKSLATSDSLSETTTVPNPAHDHHDTTNDPPDGRHGGGDHPTIEPTVTAAIRILADRQAEADKLAGKQFTVGLLAYRNGIEHRMRDTDTPALTAIARTRPGITAHELADAYSDQPLCPADNPPLEPLDDHTTDRCPCDGHGWTFHDDGAARCPGPNTTPDTQETP